MGCDLDATRNARLLEICGRIGSFADIARDCDPIVLAVFSTDQVEDVVERALLPAAVGKTIICTSTCDPDRLAALGARVEKQLRFLEAPVSGTSAQVRHGDGVGLIGGDAQIAQAAAPILDVLSDVDPIESRNCECGRSTGIRAFRRDRHLLDRRLSASG